MVVFRFGEPGRGKDNRGFKNKILCQLVLQREFLLLGALQVFILALQSLNMEVSRLNYEVHLNFGALWLTRFGTVPFMLVFKAQRVRARHGLIWGT